MRLIGILNWYEESPAWLAACISSMARAGVEHLVAVDGAYAAFPEGRARSGSEQQEAIVETSYACGLGLTLHLPPEPWLGNEVEKRSFAFQLAEQLEGDWFFLMDADQVVTAAPSLRARLEQTELDVAEVRFWQRYDPQQDEGERAEAARQHDFPRVYGYPVRCIFRALPGLRVKGNHYTYVTADGRVLWGNPLIDELEPALDLSMVMVEHRTAYRDKHRRTQQQTYYARRDRLGLESRPCFRCNAEGGTLSGLTDWEVSEQGFAAQPVPVCEECGPIVRAELEQEMRAAGHEPEEFLSIAYPVSA